MEIFKQFLENSVEAGVIYNQKDKDWVKTWIVLSYCFSFVSSYFFPTYLMYLLGRGEEEISPRFNIGSFFNVQ